MSTTPMRVQLCDENGMVTNRYVPYGDGLTYLQQHNNLAAHTGHPPVTEPFQCTGSAHLAGEVFHCTSPAHGGYVPGSPVPVFIHPDDQFFTRGVR